ncbi:hypothetical protein QTP86_003474 [Hemibagrus guttatus]|nr:hypothetical protein QTP86_003474 [Hemibagrus guttatus]
MISVKQINKKRKEEKEGASGQAGTGSFSESETQLRPATGSVLTRNLNLMKREKEKTRINREGCIRKGIQHKTWPNLIMRIVSTVQDSGETGHAVWFRDSVTEEETGVRARGSRAEDVEM